MPFDRYFIDIGIPSDYQKAQAELPLVVDGNCKIK
jgi:hypothetical protein